jgi:hypothetical protein
MMIFVSGYLQPDATVFRSLTGYFALSPFPIWHLGYTYFENDLLYVYFHKNVFLLKITNNCKCRM